MAVEQLKKKPKVRFSTKMRNHSKRLLLLAFKRVTKKRAENDKIKRKLKTPKRANVKDKNLEVSHEYFSGTETKVAVHTNATENEFSKNGSGKIVMADKDDKRIMIRYFNRDSSVFFDKLGAYTKFYQIIADERPLCTECLKYMDMVLVPWNVQKKIGMKAWVCNNNVNHVNLKEPIIIGKSELKSLSLEEQKIIKAKESNRIYYFLSRPEGTKSMRSIREAWAETDADKEWVDVMIL